MKKEKNMEKHILVYLFLGILISGPVNNALAKENEQLATELETVVVTATRTEHTLADVPEATTVISAKELEMQNATNALEALRWLPGLNISLGYGGHGQDTYMVDGLASSYTLVLVDGNRTKDRYPLSEIPISSIKRIEVVKGANSLLYGSDAMSGVINIITKKAPDKFTFNLKGTYTNGEEDSNSQEISTGFKLAKLRQVYTYRRNYTEHDIYDRDTLLAKWGIDLGENAELGFDFKFNQYEMQNVAVDRYDYHLNLDWRIDDRSSFKTKVFLRDHNSETHVGGNPLGTIGDTLYNEEEIIYTRLLGSANLITAGYQRMGENFDYAGPDDNWSKDQYSNTLFLQDEITLSESFVVVPALRGDFHNTWDDQLNPKLSMLWKATDSLRLRASWGTAFKSPTLKNLYSTTFHGRGKRGLWIIGNPKLQPEKARTLRVSAEKRFGKTFISSIALFRNDFKDMIKGGYTGRLLPDGLKEYSYKNIKEAMTQGVEMEMKYYITDNILSSLGYTYLDTEDKTTGKTLNDTVEHRITPMIRYNNEGIGFTVEVRGDYEKYAKPDDDEDEDNFIMNANISKQITNHMKIWLNGENLFDEEKQSGLARDGLKLIAGVEFTY